MVKMELTKNHKCKFCEFNAHSKSLLIKHIISEHWNEISELIDRKK